MSEPENPSRSVSPRQTDPGSELRPDGGGRGSTRSATESLRTVAERVGPYGTVVALLGLVIVFSALEPTNFARTANIKGILTSAALLAIIAGGLTACLISWDFDLSIGGMATLSGLTVALLLQSGWSIPLAVAAALALGLVVGLTNGLVVVKLRVSAFIATLAMLSILTGLGTWWASGASVAILDAGFLKWATVEVLGLKLPVILAIAWYVVLWLLLERATIGRKMYAIGANRAAARLAGLPVSRLRVFAFAICSLGAAFAGILLAARLTGGYQAAGDAFLLEAYAAVFLGAVTFRLGQFNILGTAVGILLLATLGNGLNVMGVPNYVISIVTGVILILGVAIAGTSGRLRTGD